MLAFLVVVFVRSGDSWWQMPLAGVFAVAFTQAAFLGHDAAHRQVFQSGQWNNWASLIVGNLFVGMSVGWWNNKHTRHHANPNRVGYDPDLNIPVVQPCGTCCSLTCETLFRPVCCRRTRKGGTMGLLVYAGSESYEIEDRALAHVKIAIASKLRRNESFLLNWSVPASAGSGRVSIWLSPAIPLQFRFSGSKPPELSRVWLEALERSSTGIRGMLLLNEEEAAHYLQTAGGATAP